MAGMMEDKDSPAVRTPASKRMQGALALVHALMGGTDAMRAAGQEYLPKMEAEEQREYDARLGCSTLFPAFERTVQTLSEKPFSRPLVVGDDVPGQIKEHLDDVDMQGRNLHAFAGDCFKQALADGLAGILVEFPTAEGAPALASGVRTQADERRAGLRPYWVLVRAHQLLGWRAQRVEAAGEGEEGGWKLTQLRLMEQVEEDEGAFGAAEVDQVRVLEPGKWAVYRKSAATSKWELHDDGITTLAEIPFVPVYTGRTGFMQAKPPLLELAHLNVKHWQSQSDQDNILHVARVPILCAVGVEDGRDDKGNTVPWQLKIGASSAVRIHSPEGRLEWVEHTGAAIDAGHQSLEQLKEEMRQVGAELLVIKPGQITATQVNTESAVGQAPLQRMTNDAEDALAAALALHAKYLRLDGGKGGTVGLFKDFAALSLDAASLDLVFKMAQSGKVSDQTLHEEAQRRGVLRAEVSWEEEQERLEEQGPPEGMLGLDDPVLQQQEGGTPQPPQPAPSGGGPVPPRAPFGNPPGPRMNSLQGGRQSRKGPFGK